MTVKSDVLDFDNGQVWLEVSLRANQDEEAASSFARTAMNYVFGREDLLRTLFYGCRRLDQTTTVESVRHVSEEGFVFHLFCLTDYDVSELVLRAALNLLADEAEGFRIGELQALLSEDDVRQLGLRFSQ